ncbi:cupin domain-containing protein [Mitsuaria sp. WAJ17]|uniref:cupin domain-containing protein n=1 Tax=Mitsuaria sp. WAJ17 TaxID=2761452 RepID=UPI00160245F5|nr:cupin domain-containing protein [Mitsuaria sp. WAJ17]MBB2484719.1 cupin domain-containing protein [Mitsuaria sp. WAJ17]
MTDPRFEKFRSEALTAGYAEVLERVWPPGTVLQPHTHPFQARALVVAGEMWLTAEGRTRHLRPGDRFELAAGVLHDERYGPQGASYWVARR